MRILFIEDDKSLQDVISKRLKSEGYVVDSCFDGQEGFDLAENYKYDCIILDIMLPKLNGIEVLKKLRSNGNQTNIILLTAKGGIAERVMGLNAGADDYLAKPFEYDELLARIRALMRRNSEIKGNILTLDNLVMNINDHTVKRGEKDILLTSKEYALLEYLMRNQGQILTRTQMADHVWGFDFEYDSNVVDVYIRYLRGKIDNDFDKKLIQTVRGFGYVMRNKE
jgi:DNA-binding response OmpR family regulator